MNRFLFLLPEGYNISSTSVHLFVFLFLPKVFHWTGHNQFFVKGDVKSLGIGSGEYVGVISVVFSSSSLILLEELMVYGLMLIFIVVEHVIVKRSTILD